ncbi:MAG: hypothetical protein KGZ53_09805 [Peptococcaceae bacterium]|nr:hypothetical protein [Peptococcaceae bacterium]
MRLKLALGETVDVGKELDLYALSNERANYSSGFEVSEINAEPGSEFVRFSSGRTLRLGEEIGGAREDTRRAQIKHTIKRHLDKELQVHGRGVKVLSLFFVDCVANYRNYDEAGRPELGIFAQIFEEELAALAHQERYRDLPWLKEPLAEFFNNQQRFMDLVALILKYELHRLLVDGIKYERIDGTGTNKRYHCLLCL